MPKFRVVAERSLGIRGRNREHRINPFLVRDIFGSGLRCESVQRVWEDMECENEAEVRRWFDAGQDEGLEAVRGFRIVSIELVTPNVQVQGASRALSAKRPSGTEGSTP